MKIIPKLICLTFLIIALSSIAFCARIDSVLILVDITEDDLSRFNVTLTYPEEVEMSDFYILGRLQDIHVFKGDEEINCSVEEMPLGTSIVCRNVFSKNVTYTFFATNLIETGKRLNIFSYRFPVTTLINRIKIIVKIPLGAVIADEASLEFTALKPFSPENGIKGSDGRRIFVEWNFENPKLGESITVSTIYEKIAQKEEIVDFIPLIFVFVFVFVFAIFLLFFFFRRKDIAKVLPILNDSERAVMEVIMKSGEVVDQRKIVKATGFSKSKVSRVLKDLEERGLIKREKLGRATKVKLIFGKEEERKNEGEKNKQELGK